MPRPNLKKVVLTFIAVCLSLGAFQLLRIQQARQAAHRRAVEALRLVIDCYGWPIDGTWSSVRNPNEVDAVEALFFHPGSIAIDDDTVKAIGKLHNLRIVGFASAEDIGSFDRPPRYDPAHLIKCGDDQLEYLFALEKLEELYLDGTRVTDAGLVRLAEHPNVKFICVSGTLITDEGIAAFKELRPECHIIDIGALHGYYNRFHEAFHTYGNMKSFPRLKELPGLREIRPHYKMQEVLYLRDDHLKILAQFPQLEKFGFALGREVTDDGIEYLIGHPSLKEIWINDADLSDDAVNRLKESIRKQGRELIVK